MLFVYKELIIRYEYSVDLDDIFDQQRQHLICPITANDATLLPHFAVHAPLGGIIEILSIARSNFCTFHGTCGLEVNHPLLTDKKLYLLFTFDIS